MPIIPERPKVFTALGALGAGACILALTSLLVPAPATAQSVSQPETSVPSQIEKTLGGIQQSKEATEKAGELGEVENIAITYQDLLQNPDDVGANYRFALARIRDGKLETAATALQRILLVEPGLLAVRLLYAVVLYRLDDPLEAQVEFKRVEAADPPANVKQVAEDYLNRIEQKRKAFRGDASLSVGATYDRNRNAFPTTGTALFAGTLTPLVGAKTSDTGLTEVGGVNMSYDPGGQRIREIFANASLFGIQQARVHALDTFAAIAETGITYSDDIGDIRPSLFGESIDIGDKPYLRTGGAKLGLTHYINPRLVSIAAAKIGYGSYVNSDAIPTNSDQNGMLYGTTLGLTYNATPALAISGGLDTSLLEAKTTAQAYWSNIAHLDVNYVLPWRSFVLASVSHEWRNYHSPDAFVSDTLKRRDNIYLAGVTYGLPLETLVSDETYVNILQGFVVSVFANYERNASSIPNYDWSTYRLGGLLTKRWQL